MHKAPPIPPTRSIRANIEVRFESLERDLRRWKIFSAALALGLLGLIVAAAAPATPDVVRCHRLEVVNDKGMVVSRIEPLAKADGGDGGWISCFANNGKLKVRMGAQVGGDAELDVMSGPDSADSAVAIGASPEGGGQITLNGPNQSPYVKIASPPGAAGMMSISDKKGATLWRAPGR